MTKSIEQKYRRLTDTEHVLLRPGRYIGSVKPHTAETYIIVEEDGQDKVVRSTESWNPGFLKLFDEIISNSVDHSKRPEGKHLDTIKVTYSDDGSISVMDNGGIPVVKHAEYDEYIPTLIFGYLRSGSNFDDTEDSDGTGQNGEGSSLTNIFSTRFTVETSDGKKRFKQTFSKNMTEKTEPMIIDTDEAGFTKITYTPDYAHLDTQLDQGNIRKLIKRVYDVAGCNPKLKIYLNGKRIRIDSFKDYVKLYTPVFEYDENPDWQVAVSNSDDGFRHVSFVNSTETVQGGAHIDYVVDQIVDKIRDHVRTKYKVTDLKPADIRNHMRVFINARIIRPRYDSQTKENLITEPKEFKTSYKVSQKFMDRLLKSEIIESIMTWVEAKAKAAEIAELKKRNKDADKVNPKRMLKLEDAGQAGKEPLKCFLFVTEGRSAKNAIINGRDSRYMGALELRGKPQNACSVTVKKLLGIPEGKDKDQKQKETEFFNMMVAMGLQIGVPVTDIKQLRYAHLVITADADNDGDHISGLMINNIYKFWPELFKLGVIYRFFTPIKKVWLKNAPKGSKPLSFETEEAFDAWMADPKNAAKYKMSKYFKGLGTSSNEDFKEYLANVYDHMVRIEPADFIIDGKLINLVFGKEDGSTDKRKAWLDISEDKYSVDEETNDD